MDGKEVYCVNYENGKPFVREVTREWGLSPTQLKPANAGEEMWTTVTKIGVTRVEARANP
jgi:hypothetical protein